MTFAHPYFLWLLAVLIPMTAWYVYRTRRGGAAIRISTVAGVVRAPKTVRYFLRHVPFVLRCAAVALLVVALARPRSAEHNSRTNAEGIDIMLAIDVSGSMLARDFRPDRITAAKEVAGTFIADRYGDRIGLVVFAGEAYTQSPLTTDQGTLQTLLSRIRSGLVEDGTAIGPTARTTRDRSPPRRRPRSPVPKASGSTRSASAPAARLPIPISTCSATSPTRWPT